LNPPLAYLHQLGMIEARQHHTSATADSSGRYRPPEDLLAFLQAL
jgi:hypothetical protein